MSRHLLTVADMAAGRGIEVSTVARRLADARATHQATGTWPTSIIPKPLTVPEGSHVRFGPDGALRISRSYTIPRYNGPVWDGSLRSVEAWLSAGHSNSRPLGLEDGEWMAAEYALPPAGKGRSLASLAAELGVHRDTVRRWLTHHEIPVRSPGSRSSVTRAAAHAARAKYADLRSAAAALGISKATLLKLLREPPEVTVPMPRTERTRRVRVPSGTPSGHPVDRPAAVQQAREILASGRPLSELTRAVCSARVAMPDATWAEIAAAVGSSVSSVTATFSKATKPRTRRRQPVA